MGLDEKDDDYGNDAYVSEKSKRDDVHDEEENIGGPVEEAAGEWEEEDQREENAECGDDLSVDEAFLIPCG